MSKRKPTIWIDTYRTKVPHSGLGQFSIQFAEYAVAKGSDDFQFEIFGWGAKGHRFESESTRAKWHNRYWRTGAKSDLWHSLYQLPSHLPNRSNKWLLTVHDLNFLYEKKASKAEKYLQKLQGEVNRADYITCISDYTKSDLLQKFPYVASKTNMIHNGVALNTYRDAQAPLRVNNEAAFFFSIGIFNAKKNFHLLIPLMEKFPDHHLYIAGDHQTSYGDRVRTEIEKYQLGNRIHLLGKISESEKYWCYSNAEALLFPSFAEGFGMPPIEAMSVGTPVFLSRATSLPEIGGNVAFYFDEMNSDSMAQAIRVGLKEVESNPEFRSMLIQRAQEFSWDSAMEKYLNLYRQLTL